MKIRYVTTARIPTTKANGFQIAKTCEALASRDCDVELVIPGKYRSPVDWRGKDVFEHYSIRKNFRISPVWVPPFLFLGNFGIFLQNIYFFFVAGIKSIFISKETIVYSRQPLVLIPALLFGRRAVFESHEGKWTLSVRLGVLLGLRIITITRASMDMYVFLGVKKERLSFAPDAVDVSLFSDLPTRQESRKKYGIDENAFVAMYAGSFALYEWKGFDVFLDASNEITKPIAFYAVGGLPSEIEKLEAGKKYRNVVFIGQKNQREIPALLSAADVLVIPNKKGNEVSELHTSPMKLFEYMAAGKPIVASKIPSLLEIVDETSAVIVEPNDPLALARGIEKVYEDRAFASAIAAQAKARSRAYSWDERAKGMIESMHNFYERH